MSDVPPHERLTPCEVGRQLIAIVFGLLLATGIGFGLLSPEALSGVMRWVFFAAWAFIGAEAARWVLKQLMPCEEK